MRMYTPVRQLQEMNIRTALISNSDGRMRMFQLFYYYFKYASLFILSL
jgi:hypothetical protein